MRLYTDQQIRTNELRLRQDVALLVHTMQLTFIPRWMYMSLPLLSNILQILDIPSICPPQEQVQRGITSHPRAQQLIIEKSTTYHPAQIVQRSARQVIHSHSVGLENFHFLAVLGRGGSGKVVLAREARTNNLYAIKILKKRHIIVNSETECIRSEKHVLLTVTRERHPFLLGLHSSFQTETHLFFATEYAGGGELLSLLQRVSFTPKQTKFYASEILLALEFLHSNGIIYRDLKPENILLALDGHVKVIDFGLCKENMWFGSTTKTFCGTPLYMAPEILLKQRYGRAVDWWAFGILIYEMQTGQSPCGGRENDEIFKSILEDEPFYPDTMQPDSVSILKKLIIREPSQRIGSGVGDAEELKAHIYFENVKWDMVLGKRYAPPYLPYVKRATDIHYFDEEFTRESPILTPVDIQLSYQEQQEFIDLSWVLPG